jgi:glycosyltransferase involved in cell wall biosynthesis
MVRRVRVFVYADSAIFSGAEALLCDVVAGLAEDPDIDLAVVVPPDNAELRERLVASARSEEVYPVPAQPLPLAAFHLFDPRRLRRIRRALSRAEADAMLVNLPSLEYGGSPLVTEVLPGVPKIGLAHITGSMRDLGFRLGRMRELLALRAARGLDRVLVLSERASSDFPRIWHRPDLPVHVIRMPAPRVQRGDSAAAREKLGLPHDRTLIGIAGRITVKQKGHDTLLAAAPKIVATNPDVHFAVAGQGKDQEAPDLADQHLPFGN